MVDARRTRARNEKTAGSGPVVYWMSRDQRVQENWALLYAQEKALERKVPLLVVFNLVPTFGKATLRQYDFMLRGLVEVEEALAQLHIPFFVLHGKPEETIPAFVKKHGAGEVVVDFSPLRFVAAWRTSVASAVSVCMTEVDAHNIIPCWVASDKEEFAAYTFRPKVHRLLPEFLTKFLPVKKHLHTFSGTVPTIDWDTLRSTLDVDTTVAPVSWLTPGTKAAKQCLKTFIAHRLDTYDEGRNDPNKHVVSNLSPYLHLGQISAQYVALTVGAETDTKKAARDAFLEELIVRRELADNFCFYNKEYDTLAGAHAWAQKSLHEHAKDVREYVYTKAQFEHAETHDDLWNAMQMQMVTEGKMHGWCRMYWAKKILEWTPDVQTAIDIGLYLNDKYELDGNDPNGVVGVMWSMCGVHDRAWNERPIFGKVRFMNYAGAKRKFDIKAYIERYDRKETLFN